MASDKRNQSARDREAVVRALRFVWAWIRPLSPWGGNYRRECLTVAGWFLVGCIGLLGVKAVYETSEIDGSGQPAKEYSPAVEPRTRDVPTAVEIGMVILAGLALYFAIGAVVRGRSPAEREAERRLYVADSLDRLSVWIDRSAWMPNINDSTEESGHVIDFGTVYAGKLFRTEYAEHMFAKIPKMIADKKWRDTGDDGRNYRRDVMTETAKALRVLSRMTTAGETYIVSVPPYPSLPPPGTRTFWVKKD